MKDQKGKKKKQHWDSEKSGEFQTSQTHQRLPTKQRLHISFKLTVKRFLGTDCCTVVKMPLGKPMSYTGVITSSPVSASNSRYLVMCTLGGSRRWFKYLGPNHKHGGPRLSSQLLVLAWTNLGYCGIWGNEPVDGRPPCLSVSVSFSLPHFLCFFK